MVVTALPLRCARWSLSASGAIVAIASAACKSTAPVAPQTHRSSAAAPPSVPAIIEPALTPSSATFRVTSDEGRLSVTARGQSFYQMLDAIAAHARVAIIRGQGVDDHPVTVSFKDLSPEEALRLILKNYDVFYLVGGSGADKEAASLQAVWIYTRGQGATFQPIPLEQAASTKELSQHLGDADPQIRARAIGGLAERDGNQARDSVMAALRDSDPTVRTQALYGAENGGVDLPPDTLEDLAHNDPAPEVRFLALDALQATPAGEAAAQRALQDANPRVREAASQFLQRLHAKQEPPATVTQPNPYSQ